MKKNIAVYHNTTGVAEILGVLCQEEGLKMRVASNLDELLRMINYEDIHLVLMDPELDGAGRGRGMEVIRHIRSCTAVPVMVISSQKSEAAKVMALDAGADDYVTVDDNPLVLLARVKAQLRRYTELRNLCVNLEHIYRVGNLELDDKKHTVMVNGKEAKMTPIEYKILRLLIQEKGKVLSINQIYERIWQMQAVGAENIIAVHIRHIREKIENNPGEPRYLKVVWGQGYKVG